MIEFFKNLFDPSGFPARWTCGKWTDFHGWFYIISDLLVWSAYFTIPLIILHYISKRGEIKFHRGYFLFAAFILSCGTTHLFDALMFWVPLYRLNALIIFITAILSWATVFYLLKVLPVAFSLKTNEQLEAEVENREKAERDLKLSNNQLIAAERIARMGSWEWDVAANKVSWSDGLYNIFELPHSAGGISYETFLEYVHPDDRSFVDELIRDSFSNKSFLDFFHRIIIPSGKVKILQAKGNVVFDEKGNIQKFIGTGQDVSEQKRAEQELMIKTRELVETNTELQKFAYVASHDLKEPLRKIKTYISRFEMEYSHLLTEENSHSYLNKVNNAADRMHRLMDDIMNYSKVAGYNFTFEKTDLNKIVSDVLSDIEVKIENTSAKIHTDNLPQIESNQTQIAQLFQNLITNAIKFRKPNESPKIEITSEILTGTALTNHLNIKQNYRFSDWDERHMWAREQFCKICVRDFGIGFDKAYSEKIFAPFERLHGQSEYEGSGIGLAICKKIVDHHHGSISAESSKEEGTIFTVILPVSQVNFANA